jgi:hypothetical protein
MRTANFFVLFEQLETNWCTFVKGEKTMKRSMRYGWLVVGLCVGLLVAGCASYYRVTDPLSGKEFYTQKVDTLSGGAVKVLDARSGSVVTLQNSQVKEISEKEYKAGLAAPVSKPTPTPAPATAPTPTAAPAAVVAPAAAAPAPAAAPSSEPTGTK